MAAGTRLDRIEQHERNAKWKNPPLRIEMSECINCDACLRHCPPQFGAIFNHGADVVIVPELCSGCDKCLPACPVNCIYEGDDQFYIHPDECIDCQACEAACPVQAIFPDNGVPEKWKGFIGKNREHFANK